MHVFTVQGMTCGHCVRAVTQAIQGEDPGAQVEVDLPGKQVRVDSTLAAQRIIELISEGGYQVQP
ncbi:heavy-metal-associated domain-containing protein [Pseudomonas syringae]|nr:heavy-metal-associated domain-containing protein [Pseudomonas syringae]MBD8788783.1 heavy-metal-associated domain-containing protein [Pseudomonas syringae]MBD8803954.1 heavy-metal-associated domain-containing protein [Pseudomonas syringae]MBD8811214.1 heavy-metal-associated domain-containing protein [Pseudomonas syringae]